MASTEHLESIHELTRQLTTHVRRRLLVIGPQASRLIEDMPRRPDCDSPTVAQSSEPVFDIPDGHIQRIATTANIFNESIPSLVDELHSLTQGNDSPADYALVSDIPHWLQQAECFAVLAMLRDQLARRFVLILDCDQHQQLSDTSCCTANDLYALGMNRLRYCRFDHGHRLLFGYDIHHYKSTPDWLNAKNWANPERWGKDRW